jgi:hypothetical protein
MILGGVEIRFEEEVGDLRLLSRLCEEALARASDHTSRDLCFDVLAALESLRTTIIKFRLDAEIGTNREGSLRVMQHSIEEAIERIRFGVDQNEERLGGDRESISSGLGGGDPKTT